MKKLLSLALVLVSLSASLFAANPKPVTITLWTHEDPNRQKMEEQFAAEYMAKNPHVTIKYSVFPFYKDSRFNILCLCSQECTKHLEPGIAKGLSPLYGRTRCPYSCKGIRF